MQTHPSIGCVIMASGLSRRFGSNKLLTPFAGQPMLCRAFAATNTPLLAARIVVTRSAAVQKLCQAHGVPVLLHGLPFRSDTVRLGLTDGYMQEKSSAREEYTPPFDLEGV